MSGVHDPAPEPQPIPPPFIDLGKILFEGLPIEVPTIAEAFEGRCLLYKGRLNEVHGEPSVGKTNVNCAITVAAVRAGNVVWYLDPEDNPRGITSKLASFGLTHTELTRGVRYLHNPEPADYMSAQTWAAANQCDLVICDGLAEALGAEGLNEDKPMDVLQFFRERLRPFADQGAAVLVSDHVTKNAETRGRWARGSGAKLGRYDGACYSLDLGKAYSREEAGFVKLTVSKDRVGGVGVTGQVVAELHLTPNDGYTSLEWKAPAAHTKWEGPTNIMQKILAHLLVNPGATTTGLRSLGKAEYVDQAIAKLEGAKEIRIKKGGPSKATKHFLA